MDLLSTADTARPSTASLASMAPSMVLWVLPATALVAGFTIPALMLTNVRTLPTALFALPTLNAAGAMVLAWPEPTMDQTLPLLNVRSGFLLALTPAAYCHAPLIPIARLAWLKDTAVTAK